MHMLELLLQHCSQISQLSMLPLGLSQQAWTGLKVCSTHITQLMPFLASLVSTRWVSLFLTSYGPKASASLATTWHMLCGDTLLQLRRKIILLMPTKELNSLCSDARWPSVPGLQDLPLVNKLPTPLVTLTFTQLHQQLLENQWCSTWLIIHSHQLSFILLWALSPLVDTGLLSTGWTELKKISVWLPIWNKYLQSSLMVNKSKIMIFKYKN